MIEELPGQVAEVDIFDGEVIWGEYIRIQVKLDVTKLLLRGKKIRIRENIDVWVRFSYEKLSDFCYCCGLIGHGHRNYEKWKTSKDKFDLEGMPYGQWMRAQPLGFKGGEIKQ